MASTLPVRTPHIVIVLLIAFFSISACAQDQPVPVTLDPPAAGALDPPVAGASDPPAAGAADAAQTADKKSAEWNALASTLEQRLARMLPCDARVKSTIDEVSRASDVRFAALSAYWQEIENHSKEQAQMAAKFAAETETLLGPWTKERADAQQALAQLEEHEADLRESAKTVAALTSAVRALDQIIDDSEALTKQSTEREDALAQWNARWSDVIRATELRDAAIENELKTLATERDRWNAFYAARTARAQMECSLTRLSRPAAPKSAGPRAADKKTSDQAGDKKKQ